MQEHVTFHIVLALAAGVAAQVTARRLRVPAIVLLLAVGVGLGPDGLDWVNPRVLGDELFGLVDLAVGVILFEGGLNLQISRLRRAQREIRQLVTVGAATTLGGAAVAAHFLLGWDWQLALLFGSLVVVTGPTVVGPLVSELRLRSRPATVLEAEGVLIDPIGAILAVVLLELVVSQSTGFESFSSEGGDFLLRMGFGLSAGIAAGFVMASILRSRRFLPEGYENIFVLASVLLLMQGCEEVLATSGILAVTMAGVVVGNAETRVDRDLREFKDQLTIMLIGLLFVMLAADVRFDQVRDLGWGGLLVLLSLVLVVRPLCVAISTLGSDLSWRERVFVGWIAPRGIVAAAVASLVAGALESNELPGGAALRAMVFLSIAGTVVQAGLTAAPVANWLGVRQPERDTVAILSAQGLGLLLGHELKQAGTPIVFIDTNPQNCRRAEEAGFSVVFGSALRESVMQRARFYQVRTAVGLTPNRTLNGVFAQRARENFSVPQGLVATDQVGEGLVSEMVQAERVDLAFDGPHDLERWDVRERRGEVEVVHRAYRKPDQDESEETIPTADNKERWVVLSILRDGRGFPMHARFEPRPGDIASIAIYVPERDEARLQLELRGWVHLDVAAEELEESRA